MSLNISPETKIAKVISPEWDPKLYIQGKYIGKTIELSISKHSKNIKMTYGEFDDMLKKGICSISANGVLYKTPTKTIVGKIIE